MNDADVARAGQLYAEALAMGYVPFGTPTKTGKQSAGTYVAEKGGWHRDTVRKLLGAALPTIAPQSPKSFTLPDLPDSDEPAEALIAKRIAGFGRLRESREARKLIRIPVAVDGPFGILHMGDPHVDDDGCDWPMLKRHIDLARKTPGMLAGNVGDLTNNWIGRLARLYAHQETTAKQAWKLAEWFVREVPWLYLIGGNHDLWSGDGDPIKWISRQAGVLYEAHGVRLALGLPGGRELRINGRHDFSGSSQWNPAHGPNKAAMLGPSDHIYIAGHRHVFGLNWHKQADGVWSCALRVGSYKVYDGYADARGFPDHNLAAVVTVIRPDADEAGFVEVFKDVEFAADFLTFARKKWESGKRIKGKAA